MRLSDVLDLLAPLGARLHDATNAAGEGITFTAIGLHSKKMVPGSLFLAISGTRENGNLYAREAVQRGASALVTETPLSELNIPQILVRDSRAAAADIAAAWFRHPGRQIPCYGITGTNGKTTTAYLLRSMLEAAGKKTAMLGTVGYFLPDQTLAPETTTPDPVQLQHYLRQAVDTGADAAVLEASSHALVQSRVRGIPFRAGIFTNLSHEHLDYHGSMKEYAAAKSILFEGLESGAAAILNLDDAASEEFRRRTMARVIPYAVDREGAELGVEILEADLYGTRLRLTSAYGTAEIFLRLPGRHNVANFLAAAGAALATGIPLEAVARGAGKLGAVPGRLERVDDGRDFAVFVDYAHTDDALEKVLQYLRPITRERLIVVFGCGGDRDKGKRPRMGRVATELGDFALMTSDNPRTEDPLSILGEILVGVRAPAGRYAVEPDRRKAIGQALGMARPGDVVLIAGKGHEDYQIVGKNRIHFDDREIVREVLRGTI